MFKIILDDTKTLVKENSCKYLKNKKILILGYSGVVGQYFVGLFLNLLDTKYSPKSITLASINKTPSYLNFLKKNKNYSKRFHLAIRLLGTFIIKPKIIKS